MKELKFPLSLDKLDLILSKYIIKLLIRCLDSCAIQYTAKLVYSKFQGTTEKNCVTVIRYMKLTTDSTSN